MAHHDLLGAEPAGAEGLVLPDEAHTQEAIPFVPADVGAVLAELGLDPHNRRLDLWGWSEIVLADLHDVCDLGPELGVDGQPAVEGISGTGCKAKRKFALEHENRSAWGVRHG
ncbi:unnamed protein product [Clonostachys rosea]|uniref:Uncharacterized protein n=1 Tax=Bionectria ochroleuca TaxID=29856 RepID=A0ABY6UBP0_BIOOC|nr:unnamed protein product [Clonostachys rosea]